MALRVLLADESPTIKKVIQISLQDYGVDVRSVSLGIDVLQAAQQFRPDIIFIDILLQKKNGYEVSLELKNDPQTRKIPVVLMWSGFMEIDKPKYKSSKADTDLEKPFDADALRALIQKWVPKTTEQKLAQHLVFPEVPKIEVEPPPAEKIEAPVPKTSKKASPEITKTKTATQTRTSTKTEIAKPAPDLTGTWTMDNFESLSEFTKGFDELGRGSEAEDEFKQVPLKNIPVANEDLELADMELTPSETGDEEWIQKDLSAFKLNIPEGEDEPMALDFDVDEEDLSHLEDLKEPTRTQTLTKSPAETITLSPGQLEQIVREQSRELIEKLVKKLLPEMASQIIKEELRRLLDDTNAP
jgi:CheY-like chemotaxis protein